MTVQWHPTQLVALSLKFILFVMFRGFSTASLTSSPRSPLLVPSLRLASQVLEVSCGLILRYNFISVWISSLYSFIQFHCFKILCANVSSFDHYSEF